MIPVIADLIFRYLSYNSFDTIKYELCNDICLTADYIAKYYLQLALIHVLNTKYIEHEDIPMWLKLIGWLFD